MSKLSEDFNVEEVPAVRKKPEKKAKKAEEPSKPVVARANRRLTRRHEAHVPGPRRKPTLEPAASNWKAPAGAKEESGAAASAEAKDSDEGDCAFD